MAVERLFLSAQELLETSFRLGARIIASGFRPTIIVALWRGGVPIGIAVQELLAFHGIETDHIAIRTASYDGVESRGTNVRILGMDYIIKNIRHEDRLLIVDDVFDTGHTISAVINYLADRARRNTPEDIRVAVPYFKPSRNQTKRIPDYYLYETAAWLKYPHSLEGLTPDEIAKHRPELYEIIKGHLR